MQKASVCHVGVPIKGHLKPCTDFHNICKVIWSSTPTTDRFQALIFCCLCLTSQSLNPPPCQLQLTVLLTAFSLCWWKMMWMVLHLWHSLRQVVKCATLKPTLVCTKLQLIHRLPSTALVTTNDPQFLLKSVFVMTYFLHHVSFLVTFSISHFILDHFVFHFPSIMLYFLSILQ